MQFAIRIVLSLAVAAATIASASARQPGAAREIHRHRIVDQVAPGWRGAVPSRIEGPGLPGNGAAQPTINGFSLQEWQKFAPTPNVGG